MDWHPIDDVVMGGVSHSALQPYSRGVACFGGVVSLERGGGFASVRTEPRKWRTAGAQSFVVRCRGDGRRYKFTLRTDDGLDGAQYQSRFQPPRGEWAEVALPITSFEASFRGRPVAGAGPLVGPHAVALDQPPVSRLRVGRSASVRRRLDSGA